MNNIVTPKGRLSYPHLFKKNEGGNFPSGKYETGFIIEKSEDISKLIEEAEKILKEEHPKIKNLKLLKHPPIQDGDDSGKYPGCWYIKAKSERKPKVVGYDPKHLVDDEKEVYGGQNAKVSLNFYAYNAGGNRGIGVGLGNVQILGGGEKLGSGGGTSNPEDEFTNEYDSGMDDDSSNDEFND